MITSNKNIHTVFHLLNLPYTKFSLWKRTVYTNLIVISKISLLAVLVETDIQSIGHQAVGSDLWWRMWWVWRGGPPWPARAVRMPPHHPCPAHRPGRSLPHTCCSRVPTSISYPVNREVLLDSLIVVSLAPPDHPWRRTRSKLCWGVRDHRGWRAGGGGAGDMKHLSGVWSPFWDI